MLVQDQLFATLDPTTRRINLAGGKQVLVTDTVGFIQKLPTQLVAAFRATLEEVREADLLLHVVDVSDPHLMAKVQTVEQVLAEIEASDKPVVMALNKIDLVDPGVYLGEEGNRFVHTESLVTRLGDDYEYVIPVSAQQGVGMVDLLAAIEDLLMARMVDVDTVLPYQAGDVLNLWHEQGIVEAQEYTPEGVRITGKLPRWAMGILSDETEAEPEE